MNTESKIQTAIAELAKTNLLMAHLLSTFTFKPGAEIENESLLFSFGPVLNDTILYNESKIDLKSLEELTTSLAELGVYISAQEFKYGKFID